MAMMELCAETGWTGTSPRISFSHDLRQSDGIPIDRTRSDSSLLDASIDFNFCVAETFEEESSSADELFSGGKILPILPRSNSKETHPQKQPEKASPPQLQQPIQDSKKESLREIMAVSDAPAEEKPAASKSFWRFKRSNSLNCGSGYTRSIIWKLPLLNRSNSTGSVSQNSKKEASKSAQKPKHVPFPSFSSSSKPPAPLKRNDKARCGAYGNGVRISPVLNVPPPYISTGTTNLFGLGYLFRSGKDGNKNKKKPPP